MFRPTSLVHQAFIYDSTEDFVGSMGPFVREGLERGDAIFGATTPANVAGLREELGDDDADVELHDTEDWCTRPWERLQAFRALVDRVPEGGVLRAMGEPVWRGSDAVLRQWASYESIINSALADAPMRFVCLYDGAALPDRILEYAVRTHPERIEDGAVHTCPNFVPPARFLPGPPPPAPDGAIELRISSASGFRRFIADHARRVGLTPERIGDLVLATNEVVTNALMHGRPPARARVWVAEGELVCAVVDTGPGISDPLAGWLPPSANTAGGWGLAIARQLCDVVDIRSTPQGAEVAVHVSLC